jgi:hypothetical protein
MHIVLLFASPSAKISADHVSKTNNAVFVYICLDKFQRAGNPRRTKKLQNMKFYVFNPGDVGKVRFV